MGGCSADYCTNSSRKGFQMCNIPQKAKRRKIWLQNINRQDWIAGNKSQLCHAHFAEDMWKTTSEGKRRLKSNAVPTIFHNRTILMSSDPEQLHVDAIDKQNEQCKENSDPQVTLAPGLEINFDSIIDVTIKNEDEESNEDNDTDNSICDNDTSICDSEAIADLQIQEHSIEESECADYSEESTQKEIHKKSQEYIFLKKRFDRLEKLFNASYKSALHFKKELVRARHRIKVMENKIQQLKEQDGSNLLKALRKIWNDDQIQLISQAYKKVPRWSNETLRNAYKLRAACGTAGYEEILRQNLPYPSIKTLTKRLNIYSDHSYSRNIRENGITKNATRSPQKRKPISLLHNDAEVSLSDENPDKEDSS